MSADKRSQSGGREEAFRAALYVSRRSAEPQVGVAVRTEEKLRLKAAVCRGRVLLSHREILSFYYCFPKKTKHFLCDSTQHGR